MSVTLHEKQFKWIDVAYRLEQILCLVAHHPTMVSNHPSSDRWVAKRLSCKEGNSLVAREAKVLCNLCGMRVCNVVTRSALLLARSHRYK
jgi:hypothetical protein